MRDNTDILIEQTAETNDLLKALILKENEKPDLSGTLKDDQTIVVKGQKGDKGDAPTEEELLSLIKPLIPEPKPGQDGKDGRTPITFSSTEPINPQIGDIWIQN